MTDNKPDGLESVVKDAYIVYFEEKDTSPVAAEEKHQRFEALVQRIEQLQQQYGIADFSYRKFEFTPAVAAVIKGEKKQEIIGILQQEGYVVKEQGRMSTQG